MTTTAIFDTPYDSLPDKKRVWIGAPGSREEGLGKLAILTPDVVAKAASEIRTGKRITLSWDLEKLENAGLGRQKCEHKIVPLLGGIAFDDIYTFNPQQSSQWDGLRHFSQAIPGTEGKTVEDRVFYGGTTAKEILDREGSDRIGFQHWAKEGIAGRGVLIDYASWAEKKGIQYTTFSQHEVKLSDIEEIAKECNITFQKGDILFVRVGMTKEWDNVMTAEQKIAYGSSESPQHAGVEGTEDVLRWIWNNKFSAVAGDAISWEVYPPKDKLFLHGYLIAGWGMPIGEMFDLEDLSRICKEEKRWTFFISSTPLNMRGGVSSPPNCMAIF